MSEFTILNCDCREVAELVPTFDVMIADPPYREHVHKSAVSCASTREALADPHADRAKVRDLGFGYLTPGLRRTIAAYAAAVKKWSLIYSDSESTNIWRHSCGAARKAAGLKGEAYIRPIPWIRWSMPQLSEDRPTTGHEMLTLYWGAQGGSKKWSGPGNLIEYRHEDADAPPLDELTHKCLRGKDKHKTEKPLDQALDLVEWFSEPGDTVFDPTCGRGTVGLACALLGRNFVGCEIDEDEAKRAEDRIAAFEKLSDRDAERWRRFDVARAKRLALPATSKHEQHYQERYACSLQ